MKAHWHGFAFPLVMSELAWFRCTVIRPRGHPPDTMRLRHLFSLPVLTLGVSEEFRVTVSPVSAPDNARRAFSYLHVLV
ncbi:hypothetical protein NDU88_001137 [Pleurodeles waltl]|uniref:Secreted protein n=1 Tax=Pleurodeles waltl TaxID=8319 RepID=A0AAV7WHJ4_PLEWA|nr:hypothetical protein NDU88_001137 [Pleurodeles waltl]